MNANATANDQIKSDRSAKTILVTGATGDTGRPTVKLPWSVHTDEVSSAYFVYPMLPEQVEASAIFAQVARERRLEMVASTSHKQSRPYARSPATAAHWLSEQFSTGRAFQLPTSGLACLPSGYFISHLRSGRGGT